MTNDWNWPGSRWWKFDFHTHTPASDDDYGRGSQDQESVRAIRPREWLLEFMRREIDCVAVTDHHSGEWIDRLKAERDRMRGAPGFRELVLFPGVELSAGGVHVLFIFDPTKSSADIDRLLGAAGYTGRRGWTGQECAESLSGVLDKAGRYDCLAIPAHVDRKKGLLVESSAMALKGLLQRPDLFCWEIKDRIFQKPQAVLESGRKFAEVLGSDSHCPDSAGESFTWVKMSAPTLDGLRLALLEGEPSLRRSDECASDPNCDFSDLGIEELEVERAKYMGRSEPLRIGFNPWLNAIIGGRGTGKSSLVEFLRIVFRREDEIAGSGIETDLSKYRRVSLGRGDPGLLLPDAKLRVVARKQGQRFRLQWSPDGRLPPIQQETEGGGWSAGEGEIKSRFPVRIYSQKQIFELAQTPDALRKTIDDSPEVQFAEWKRRWARERSELLRLSSRARELRDLLKEQSRIRGELDDAHRKIAVFEESQHSQVLRAYHLTRKQLGALEEWTARAEKAAPTLAELASDWGPGSIDETLFQDTGVGEELLNRAAAVRASFESLEGKLFDIALEAGDVVSEWSRWLEGSAWKKASLAAQQSYAALVERLGDPAEYGQLVQTVRALESQLAASREAQDDLDALGRTLKEAINRLAETRRELSGRRARFLEKTLKGNPNVRIELIPYGDGSDAEENLREILGIDAGRFQADIWSEDGTSGLLGELYLKGNYEKKLISSLDAQSSTDPVGEFETRLERVKQRIRDGAIGKSKGFSGKFANRLVELSAERLDLLDAWYPEDSLQISYRVDSKGGFRPIEQGSPGQKTAAILAFVLSYGEEPLILDQPEDDLDNHLIYDLIVSQLQENKRRRQIILVTHNPNLVVAGDAELVVSLRVRGGQTLIGRQGGLGQKDVRVEVSEIMEGGKEAFEKRYRRIVNFV